MVKAKKWNNEEVKTLEREYKKLTDKEIGNLLGRPESGVKDKRRRLGLVNYDINGKITGQKASNWRGGKVDVNCKSCGAHLKRAKWEIQRADYFLCDKEECRNWTFKQQIGGKHPRYKGKWKSSDGYILVHKPKHPKADKAGYVREHVLVAEKKIGRYLTKKEVVHHIDFDRSNNNIENLMIFPTNSEHIKFHTKLRQFGETGPIRRQIETRWEAFRNI